MKDKDRPIRHLPPPKTFGQWLYRYRYTWYRRICQFALLAAFIGTFRWGWEAFGHPLLEGDLSFSRILNVVPLADPFAAIQRFLAEYWLSPETLIAAGLVLFIYLILSGRTFCAWVCPMNLVTDFAFWLRTKLGIKTNWISLPSRTRYLLLILCLILCLLTGQEAFEAVSPQALIWREAVYGIGMGFFSAVFGILAIDLAISRRAWCGHLCPLGAFWAVWGKVGAIKVAFDNDLCTRCGDCLKVCPEPQVIDFNKIVDSGNISSGECTNCGKCIAICPEKCFKFSFRYKVQDWPIIPIKEKK
ncbi:MAG: quinol dehydrogenase ferredoxin subunit NapH [Burkholderiales bacterium]|nr:quinol dehydrogenase ferredoxin subunit NapH [Burkholderiales bacterium]